MTKLTDRHVAWARSEAMAQEMTALGWKHAEQRVTRHSHYALLMIWDSEGEPRLPKAEKK